MISSNESFEEWIHRMWIESLRRDPNVLPASCGWIPERYKRNNARPLPEV